MMGPYAYGSRLADSDEQFPPQMSARCLRRADRTVASQMIYFFSKHQQFLQCEVHPGPPRVLRVIEPGGHEQTERCSTAAELQLRWEEVRRQLQGAGWSGPFGRDPRI